MITVIIVQSWVLHTTDSKQCHQWNGMTKVKFKKKIKCKAQFLKGLLRLWNSVELMLDSTKNLLILELKNIDVYNKNKTNLGVPQTQAGRRAKWPE